MAPEARKEQVLAQEVGDELVVYDERTHEAHRLNRTAAIVWRHADGSRSLEEIAAVLHDELQAPEGEDLARLSLAELERAGLLASPLAAGEIVSRRHMLTAAVGMLPIVASMLAPTPAMAATIIVPSGPSPSPFNGTYAGSGTTTPENCGGLRVVENMRGVLTVDTAGRGTWRKTHTDSNVVFEFPVLTVVVSGTTMSVRASSSRITIGGVDYVVEENYTISGNTLTGTQTFSQGGTPPCSVVYDVRMTRLSV